MMVTQDLEKEKHKEDETAQTPLRNTQEAFEKLGKIKKAKDGSEETEQKRIENEIVLELNQKHAVVHAGQFYILTEKPHPLFKGKVFNLEPKYSFLNTYENQIPEGHTKSKAKIWISHPERRQFDNGITFDPTTTEHRDGFYPRKRS